MDIFNNLQVINECLLDVKRTRAFEKAINATVSPNSIVLDCGTGTGIMALLAARAGAKQVYAVDIADDTIKQARQNINANKEFAHKISVIQQDLKQFNHNVQPDIIIMEMMDTGLIAEQQAIALNHLHASKIISEKTTLIPYKVDNYIEAIEYDFNFYGFNMPSIIQARNFRANHKIKKILSKPTLYNTADFRKQIKRNINETIAIQITNTGTCNAVRIKTRTSLTKKQQIWGTSDMNMPVIIPVNAVQVKKNETIWINIQYTMSEGFNSLKLTNTI